MYNVFDLFNSSNVSYIIPYLFMRSFDTFFEKLLYNVNSGENKRKDNKFLRYGVYQETAHVTGI